ncbi:hypothetical protein RJ640_005338 [Escallonia rubra]|uniref:Uncharacterized protein n=1 Tax=Escallonia rubra TaxID=112253 RepID=A0AA88QD91_9ASTE|nr:hypothetical protein RJ640_005338 [Escallonia rubra]
MLLHGNISIPLRSPLRLRAPYLRNVTVSAHPPIKSEYTVSDESLQSRGFTLRRTIEDLNLDHLNTVFVAVGFPRRDTDKVRLALENTDTLLWYEYEKTKRPVAFARATGDGVFNAIIWDVVVDPNRPSHNAICCAFSFIAYHLTT